MKVTKANQFDIERFMEENIMNRIPNKDGHTIFCLYTNYESDHLHPYDVVLGCKVKNTDNIPEGFTHLNVPATENFLAKGNIEQGEAVIATWMEVWKSDLNRTYSVDYEVYDERSADLKNAEVDIFIALKS